MNAESSQGRGSQAGAPPPHASRQDKARRLLADVAGLLGAREALILSKRPGSDIWAVEHRLVRASRDEAEPDVTAIARTLEERAEPQDLGVQGEERLVGCPVARSSGQMLLAFVSKDLPPGVWQAVLRLATARGGVVAPSEDAAGGRGQPPELAPKDIQHSLDRAYAAPFQALPGVVAAKRGGFGGRWRRLGGRDSNRALREEMHRALESLSALGKAHISEAGHADPLSLYATARGWGAALGLVIPMEGPSRAGLILGFQDADTAEAAAADLQTAMPGFAAWMRAHKTGISAEVRRVMRDHPTTVRRAGLGAAAALVLLALLPVPAVVEADAVLRPSAVHLVAAPFDGQLASVSAGPGDAVDQGEVLARMDEQDLDLELSTAEAQRQRALTAENQARALGRVDRAAEAAFEGQSLTAQIALLERRRQRTTLRSPVAGRILNDAFEGGEGAAVRRGDIVFEVAPGDAWDVKLMVLPWNADAVAMGSDLTIRLEAAAGSRLTGTLTRIAPEGSVHKGRFRVVFIGSLEPAAPEAVLVSGLEGKAKIRSGWTIGLWRVTGPAVRRARAWLATL